MPELITTYAREDHYFGVVRKVINGIAGKYEFGMSEEGYKSLKKILEFRPFDLMPGLEYRYYFMSPVGSYHGTGGYQIQILVIQGNDRKAFQFKVPQTLMSNLTWFMDVASADELTHLKRAD